MAARRVAVAYSGGRDSTALLHATLRSAAALGIEVVALHVHHGLSPNADAWLDHCRRKCVRWAGAGRPLTFMAMRLQGSPSRGESIEAWARRGRYAALREMAAAHGATLVFLAHHRRDQAETLLLQALRGSGLAGLAGMPKLVEREAIAWARPWLDEPRETIDEYVRTHRLTHIDDESNADARFARNRLRLQVWPQLLSAFPQADTALASAAAWAHEAASALAELATMDLAALTLQGGFDVVAWTALSPARRSNALRAWLRRQTGAPAGAALIARLARELPQRRGARWPHGGGELRSHRGVMTWQPPGDVPASPVAPEAALTIPRAGTYRLPGWGGAIEAKRASAGGVALALLADLELRPRRGEEQFQAGLGRPPRSLKKQYQAAGVAAWERSGPILYSAGRIVFVPGLGIDARSLARSDDAQLTLEWIRDPTLR